MSKFVRGEKVFKRKVIVGEKQVHTVWNSGNCQVDRTSGLKGAHKECDTCSLGLIKNNIIGK